MKLRINGRDLLQEITPKQVKEKLFATGAVNMIECYKHYPTKFIRAVARENDFMVFHHDENEQVHQVSKDFPNYNDLVELLYKYAQNIDWKSSLYWIDV
jgi:hypothetical protein